MLKLFNRKQFLALLASALFLINFSVVYSVILPGMIFDLLGNTLVLVAFFLQGSKKHGIKCLNLLIIYLAIRIKEHAILLPIILLMQDYLLTKWVNTQLIKRALDVVKNNMMSVALFATFCVRYLYLYLNVEIPEGDPYRIQFDINEIIKGLNFHFSNLTHTGLSIPSFFTYIALLVALIVGFRNKKFMLLFTTSLVLLIPTLIIGNRYNPLYFYISSSFLFMGITSLLNTKQLIFSVKHTYILFALLFLLALFLKTTPYYKSRINYALAYGAEYRNTMDNFKALVPSLDETTKITIVEAPVYFNVFDYGPCYSVSLFYKVKDIECDIYESTGLEVGYTGNTYVFKYNGGNLIRLN